MIVRRFVTLSLLALAFAGCTDRNDPAAPTGVEPTYSTSSEVPFEMAGPPGERDKVAKFTIDLEIQGNLRPNQPVTVRATTTTNLPAEDPEVYMVFPEIEAANASAWDDRFRLPVSQRFARRARVAAGRTGQSQTITVEQVVPESPGYYRVVVTARDNGVDEPTTEDGRFIVSTVHKTAWLWIDESSGRVTETLDGSLFPEGAVRQPGPLRMRRARPTRASFWGGLLKPAKAALRELGFLTPTIASYQIMYYNEDTSETEPVAEMYYDVDHIEDNGRGGTVVGNSTGYSTGSGTITFECESDSHRGNAIFDNGEIFIYNGSGASIIGDQSDCDPPSSIQITVNSDQGHVFTTLNDVIDDTYSTYGYNRSELEVHLHTSGGSYYDPDDDEVWLENGTGSNDDVWASWGQFVMSHEFAHALHGDAFQGIPSGYNCPKPHYLDTSYHLNCAFTEGWADFFGNEYSNHFGDNFDDNDYYDDDDGSIIEGAVAAFFTDLVDSTVEAHDSIDFPHSYVADVMDSCQGKVGSSWQELNGVDYFVYCAENQVDSAVVNNYFDDRSPLVPNDYRESVTEPGSWDADKIRACWLENLFG